MNEHHSALLTIAARLTGYPSESFREELDEIQAFANEVLEEGPIQAAILRTTNRLNSLSLREVQEQYVAAFDLKDRTGLYLTAHELGDSRNRGVALLQLREYVRSHGFMQPEDELPDYLPMLYEFASAVEGSDSMQHLLDRMAFATNRIRLHLPEENPYKSIFDAMMMDVFEAPEEQVMQQREKSRAKPDLDPMPYPLMFK